jgi:hypothetical protein
MNTTPFALVAAILGGLICPAHGAQMAPSTASAEGKARQAAAWADIARWPNLWEGSWQGISPILEEFATPPVYTPQARKFIDTFKPVEDSNFANCHPQGMPFVMNIAAMPLKFFPTAGMIALYIEGFGTTRFIQMDGRKHSESPNPTYLGESIGHWEGDTLVVSTVGLKPDTTLQIGLKPIPKDLARDSLLSVAGSVANPGIKGIPVYGQHGPDLTFVERMRLKNFNTLEIQTTVYDATIFAKPYTFPPRTWHRYVGKNSEPQEWYCSDNRDYISPETGKLEYGVTDKAISR